MSPDDEPDLSDYYEGDLDWIAEAGIHLAHAVRLYRRHVRPEDNGGPDVSLMRYLYDLQGAIE